MASLPSPLPSSMAATEDAVDAPLDGRGGGVGAPTGVTEPSADDDDAAALLWRGGVRDAEAAEAEDDFAAGEERDRGDGLRRRFARPTRLCCVPTGVVPRGLRRCWTRLTPPADPVRGDEADAGDRGASPRRRLRSATYAVGSKPRPLRALRRLDVEAPLRTLVSLS